MDRDLDVPSRRLEIGETRRRGFVRGLVIAFAFALGVIVAAMVSGR